MIAMAVAEMRVPGVVVVNLLHLWLFVDQGDDEAKKRQKRGGKGMLKAKKKEAELEKKITLSIAPRGKKKAVTVVQGNNLAFKAWAEKLARIN